MKKLALVLNALLAAFLLMMFVAEGPPRGELVPFVLAVLGTSATTLYAFRSHFFGSEEESASTEERVAAAPEPSRVEAPADRKPLYEWLDTVEERLEAVEAERAEQ